MFGKKNSIESEEEEVSYAITFEGIATFVMMEF